MAGDWIKLRKSVLTHPRLVRTMSALNADRLRTLGGIVSAWCLLDEQTSDGKLDGYTPEILDELVGLPGLARAMEVSGWLVITTNGLEAPDFEKHNGSSAKRRAQESDRKTSARNADKYPQPMQTNCGPEKRREEKSKLPPTPKGDVEGFDQFWSAYPKRKSRASAVKAWAKAVKLASVQTIIAAVEQQKLGPDWTKDGGKYIPHPASWLNAEAWQDDLQIQLPATTSATSRPFTPEDWA